MAPSLRSVGTALATTLLVVVASAQLLLLVLVVDAAHGPPQDDPHGYAVIFGVVMILVLSPATVSLVVLLCWLRARR